MPKLSIVVLLLFLPIAIVAQNNSSTQSNFYIQQSDAETGIQLQIPVNVKEKSNPHYSFDTLLSLMPVKGYDADKKSQSIKISEILIFTGHDGKKKTKISGRLSLECCFGVIARVDLQDRLGNSMESTNTNDKGEFSIVTDHNNILTEDRKNLVLRFGKLTILDLMGNKHEYRVKKML